LAQILTADLFGLTYLYNVGLTVLWKQLTNIDICRGRYWDLRFSHVAWGWRPRVKCVLENAEFVHHRLKNVKCQRLAHITVNVQSTQTHVACIRHYSSSSSTMAVSEMTYTLSSGTLNSAIPYYHPQWAAGIVHLQTKCFCNSGWRSSLWTFNL